MYIYTIIQYHYFAPAVSHNFYTQTLFVGLNLVPAVSDCEGDVIVFRV